MATCPACGTRSRTDVEAFTLQPVMVAKSLGDFALAGQTPKVVAVERWKLSCRCGWSILGQLQGDDFLGDAQTQTWPTKGDDHGPERPPTDRDPDP
jgi:hypothetical protein